MGGDGSIFCPSGRLGAETVQPGCSEAGRPPAGAAVRWDTPAEKGRSCRKAFLAWVCVSPPGISSGPGNLGGPGLPLLCVRLERRMRKTLAPLLADLS